MADYFALLGEERRPYLDPERVTERFRDLSRIQHPDRRQAQAETAEGEFTAEFALLNQAQQTLRDPKLRLGYLLGLEFPEVRLSGPAEVPRELAGWLSPVHALLGQVDDLLARKAAAPSALARALLAREELQLREEVETRFADLKAMYAAAIDGLREYDAAWQPGTPSGPEPLLGFYHRFSYLSRWLEQFRERLFQLGQ
jgi:DnaJ-domain-containing protein 1